MKLGLFTDVHYCHADVLCNTRRPSLSLGKVRAAMEAFQGEAVDLCICLGDLTDHPAGGTREETLACLREVVEIVRAYPIPFLLVPGNHDYLMLSADELLRETKCEIPPYVTCVGGYDLIVLDANYRSNGERFDRAGVEWTDSNLAGGQLEFLRDALQNATRECIILVHENLDPYVESRHVIKQAETARRIIAESGKVRLVLQGHYHAGADHMIDGIRYLTLPAMCEGEENHYAVMEL